MARISQAHHGRALIRTSSALRTVLQVLTTSGQAEPVISRGKHNYNSDNGLLLIDSDLFGADANYSAAWIENSWVQTTDPIDCSCWTS